MPTVIKELIIDASTPAGQGALQFAYEHEIPYSGYVSELDLKRQPALRQMKALTVVPKLRSGSQTSLGIRKADATLALGERNYRKLSGERATARVNSKAFFWQGSKSSEDVCAWLDTIDKPSITLFISGPSAAEDTDAFSKSYKMLETLLTTL